MGLKSIGLILSAVCLSCIELCVGNMTRSNGATEFGRQDNGNLFISLQDNELGKINKPPLLFLLQIWPGPFIFTNNSGERSLCCSPAFESKTTSDWLNQLI